MDFPIPPSTNLQKGGLSIALPSAGFHYGVPFETYQQWDAINISTLKPMRKSPMHCKWDKEHPRHSDEMDVGSALHVSILEPARFEKEFYLGKAEYNAATKEGKEIRAAEEAEAAGRTYIRRKAGKDAVDADDVEGMSQAVRNHIGARRFLDLPGQCEVAMLWQDPETGLRCKARFDKLMGAARPTILEIKTDKDPSDWSFGRTVADKGYDAQAAYYCWAHKSLTGVAPLHLMLAIENKGPWAVALYVLDDATMQAGANKFRKWLNEYAACLKSGQWPGYANSVQELSTPNWNNGL